jgi:hypothetical protein
MINVGKLTQVNNKDGCCDFVDGDGNVKAKVVNVGGFNQFLMMIEPSTQLI